MSNATNQRGALVAGVVIVAILAVFLVAHAVKGTPKAAAASSAPAMSQTSMGATTPKMASGTAKVMTVRGATLPMMQTSGAMPMAMAMVPLGQSDLGRHEHPGPDVRAGHVRPLQRDEPAARPPDREDSFHLMVSLSDARPGYAIPYSSVWATISKGGKIVFDERLWPMISRYMGPHYGNNVTLPSAGLYHLTLLVSPPAAARHLEYKGLWLTPHRVNMTFRWVPKT